MRTSLKKIFVYFILSILVPSFLTSCYGDRSIEKPDEIRLAYTGSAFDLPLIAAYQNGYFEEEGLKIILVPVKKGELGNSIRNGIEDGGTADASVLIDIYAGLPAKIGAGVRGGCVEILASPVSGIKAVKDLEGKRVGVKEGGIEEAAAAVEVLEQNGVEGVLSVDWIYTKKEELSSDLAGSRIDALVRWQGEDIKIPKEAVVIYQNSTGMHSGLGEHSHGEDSHFYESFAVLSENFAVNYPESASAVLVAWVKGVNALADGAGYQLDLAEQGGFLTDDSQNTELEYFMFVPGIKNLPRNLNTLARIQKSRGLLGEEVETEDFIDKVFVKLLPDWG